MGKKVPKPVSILANVYLAVSLRQLAVKYGDNSNLNKRMAPALRVLGSCLDIFHAIVASTATIRLSKLCTSLHDYLIFRVQEVGGLVILRHNENANACPDDGNDSFDYVKPLF